MKRGWRVHTASIIDVVSAAVCPLSLTLSVSDLSPRATLCRCRFLALVLSPLTLVTQTRKPFRHQCCRLIQLTNHNRFLAPTQ